MHQAACEGWQEGVESLRQDMAAGQNPSPDRVRDLLLSAAATGAALGHMDDLQAVLLEGRTWQARASAVLQQPTVVAAAAAAVEADPCASICSAWNADIAAAASMEMNELEGLIGEGGG